MNRLDGLTSGAKILHNAHEAVLVDRADRIRRYLHDDPAIFFYQEEALRLQIRQKTAQSLLVRERYLMTLDGLLTSDLTYACHAYNFLDGEGKENILFLVIQN